MSATLSLPGVDALPPQHLRQRALSQWFTPADVAERMVAPSRHLSHARVLEPSAGHGALVSAVLSAMRFVAVDACELDPEVASRIPHDPRVRVDVCDYLTRAAPTQPYDLAVMNPPYEDGMDGAFLEKAMRECLRITALIRIAALCGKDRYERVWRHVDRGEWRCVGLHPIVARPSFLASGEASESAKSDFVCVRLTRVAGTESVPMGWW